MKNKMSRRSFLKMGGAVGAMSIFGGAFIPDLLGKTLNTAYSGEAIDISVVEGMNYFENTLKAVEVLGGMEKFVSKNARVGLLVNSPWKNPGTYTNPDVALAAIKMCYDAGAKEIYSIEGASQAYWNRSNLVEKFSDEIRSLKSYGKKDVKVEIPRGKNLKKAEVTKDLLECDVLIDIPISKDHAGTRFTGTLKNMMGASSSSTNRFFHLGSGAKGYYGDVEFLSQCIADLNLVRKPDLCISDATEFVTTNGPAGPGQIKKAYKIVVGVDRVAVDAYTSTLLGHEPKNVQMIKMANEHGLGEIDLTKIRIKEMNK